MWQGVKQGVFVALFSAVFLFSVTPTTNAQVSVMTKTGSLADGATYLIQVPSNWNHTLFLYSHGYVVPASPNPAQNVGDPLTGAFLLQNGFALAGSSYAHTGWAIQEALVDQIQVLDVFDADFGKPNQTIAWGHSLGGIITAGLVQNNPGRFTAAQPMCGVLAGGVATWNAALDGEFAFKTLLAPNSDLQLVNITNPNNLNLAEGILAAAQATPQGRARIALGAALADTPGWFTPLSPEPAANDFASQEQNQFLWDQQVDFPFVFAFRAELEARAGGNPSWNTGVDFRQQLAKSIDLVEVVALYEAAGLDLNSDLETLNRAARISADPPAFEYLVHNITYNGEINIPVLTLHTKGDGLVVVQNESAYRHVVDQEGNGELLRRDFVDRAGHCAFTPAETIAAVEKLLDRMNTGRWHEPTAAELNASAAALGPAFNIFATSAGVVAVPPAFIDFIPSPYLRPFDLGDDDRGRGRGDDHDGERGGDSY